MMLSAVAALCINDQPKKIDGQRLLLGEPSENFVLHAFHRNIEEKFRSPGENCKDISPVDDVSIYVSLSAPSVYDVA